MFKRVDGQPDPWLPDSIQEPRFLLVGEGKVAWSIRSSITATGALITSGRATNSPSSAEAGPSGRDGVTRWRYYANGSWKESDITVTCVKF